MIVRIGDTSVGITDFVSRNGVPQSGETVVLAIADPDVAGSWLDFNDSTFKTSGWTTRTVTMTEDATEAGLYKYVWNSATAVTTERRVVAHTSIASGNNRSQWARDLWFQNIVAEIDANEAKLDIIDSNVDAILVDTGTTLPAQITGIETSINANVDAAETSINANIDSAESAILAAISGLVIPSAAAIADAVWDELLAGHAGAGSAGAALSDVLTDTGTTLPAQISGIETSINANVDAAEAAILAAIAALSIPTVGAIADAVWDEVMAGHITAGTAGLFMRKLLSAAIGKVVYDETASTMTLYQHDSPATVENVFDMKKQDGTAAGTDPHFEKIPQ